MGEDHFKEMHGAYKNKVLKYWLNEFISFPDFSRQDTENDLRRTKLATPSPSPTPPHPHIK
jgi:hypothetical protein